MRLMIAAIIVLLFVVILMYRSISKNEKEKLFRHLTIWCCKDLASYQLGEILEKQKELGLDEKYWICESDFEYVEDVLKEYRENLESLIFRETVPNVRINGTGIDQFEFFFFTLDRFIYGHECDDYYCKHDMHKHTISDEYFNEEQIGSHDAIYEQTDFAIAYEKLSLVTFNVCKDLKTIKVDEAMYNDDGWIRKIIDTRQIIIWHIHP